MKTITQTNLEIIEETRQRYFDEVGRAPQDDKRQFINWYLRTHKGNYDMLISDLSEYYLFISESRILRYLNEKG